MSPQWSQSPGPGSKEIEKTLPQGIIRVVGHIHSHPLKGDNPNAPSKGTISSSGDKGIEALNPNIAHYYLFPNGKLQVLRPEQEEAGPNGERKNNENYHTIATNCSGYSKGACLIKPTHIIGPKSTLSDFDPVDNDEPIPGVYDPKIYRPPGYDNPMDFSWDINQERHSVIPPWIKKNYRKKEHATIE